jgi:hypothetical protein
MRLSKYAANRPAGHRAAASLALLVALGLGGCAGSQSYDEGSWLGGSSPPPRLAMEDDGMPAQIPPLRKPQPEKDDPREPYSRNYGPPPAPEEKTAPATPPIPADLPPAFRRQLAVAMTR